MLAGGNTQRGKEASSSPVTHLCGERREEAAVGGDVGEGAGVEGGEGGSREGGRGGEGEGVGGEGAGEREREERKMAKHRQRLKAKVNSLH